MLRLIASHIQYLFLPKEGWRALCTETCRAITLQSPSANQQAGDNLCAQESLRFIRYPLGLRYEREMPTSAQRNESGFWNAVAQIRKAAG